MTARLVVALEPDEDDLALLEGYARLASLSLFDRI